MAEVWLGRDELLGRPVAVKILHGNLVDDEELLERFRREAMTAARLSHPAVVRTFDTGEDEGTPFIVMELAEGPTLADLLAEGPLPADRAIAIARGVLEGLAHAHAHGVVHRDVKPANVILPNDHVKVADFGIARATFAEGDLTSTGQLLGTVDYLAPEQIEGDEIDARADVYAVGVILYQMLTGRLPFEAETPIAAATLRLTGPPDPPGALRPGIPRDLEAVVMIALARDPAERFAGAQEMIAALDRCAAGGDEAAPLAPPGGRAAQASLFRSWMLVPLVLLGLAALAVGAGIFVGTLELGGPLGVRPKAPEPTLAAARGPLSITQLSPYDPLGDGDEHGENVAEAADGNPETAWATEGYTTADLGGAKEGVGLLIDLGSARSITGIRIETMLEGWSFELMSSEDGEEFSQPLPSLDGERSFTASATTEIALDGVRARHLLVWITELVDDGEGNYRAAVAEVGLTGDQPAA